MQILVNYYRIIMNPRVTVSSFAYPDNIKLYIGLPENRESPGGQLVCLNVLLSRRPILLCNIRKANTVHDSSMMTIQ